jgi:hypothetical protein
VAIASVTYNTSGSAGPYTVTFPYLEEADVLVFLDGVANTAFTFTSATQITLNSAPSAIEIEIRRSTDNDPYVDFTAPGPITPENLDTATLQAIYIAQEAKDGDERSLQLDAGSDFWDAESKRIQNLATPTAANHATTKAYVDAIATAAGNVPAPGDPTDDGKFLKADSGDFSWQDIVAADISDSTAPGRAVVTVATNAALLTQVASGGSATINTLLNAASAAAARTALDVPSNAEAILDTLIDAKGDLLVGTADNTVARQAIGTNTQILTVDLAEASGMKWANPTTPTTQTFLSGSSATYTTPAGVKYIEIEMVGGGGGGAGGNVASDAGAGGASTFSGGSLSAGGGAAGALNGASGASGAATGGNIANILGATGLCPGGAGASNQSGGSGASSLYGGAGSNQQGGANAGGAAQANTGSGGAGGSIGAVNNPGGGGGAGSYVKHRIAAPAATYTYTVGAAGTAGSAGASAGAGGAGAAGRITVHEYYI